MKKLLAIVSTLAVIAGCVSATEIMESYVGKDVREVVIDYGPPANAMDMDDGRRAFQWVMTSSRTTPTTARTTGTVSADGDAASVSSRTRITGGQTINSRRIYTLYGEWDESRNGWIITSFEQPRSYRE